MAWQGFAAKIGFEALKTFAKEEALPFVKTIGTGLFRGGFISAASHYVAQTIGRRGGLAFTSKVSEVVNASKEHAVRLIRAGSNALANKFPVFRELIERTDFIKRVQDSKTAGFLGQAGRRFVTDTAIQLLLTQFNEEIDKLAAKLSSAQGTEDQNPGTGVWYARTASGSIVGRPQNADAGEEGSLEARDLDKRERIVNAMADALKTFVAVVTYSVAGKYRGNQATNFKNVPLTDRDITWTVQTVIPSISGRFMHNATAAAAYYKGQARQAVAQIVGATAAVAVAAPGETTGEKFAGAAEAQAFRLISPTARLFKKQGYQQRLFKPNKVQKPRKTKRTSGVSGV